MNMQILINLSTISVYGREDINLDTIFACSLRNKYDWAAKNRASSYANFC